MSTHGDNAHSRAEAATDRLEWQSELDSALSDIDSRLSNPRRPAGEGDNQPTLPLNQIELTSDVIEEIAVRVAEKLRQTQPAAPATAPAPAPARAAARPAPPPPPEPERMPHGIAITIRLRKPLFRFRFWRRRRVRRESLISFADYRIT